MIDLNRRLNEKVLKTRKYGFWVANGGLVVIFASLVSFVVELLRLVHVARMPQIKSGSNDMHKLQE